MIKKPNSKKTLLNNARQLFWSRGYSNVSVREIARAAGVDVALIARYFGSKLGLFKATLTTLEKIDPSQFPDTDALVEMLVELFANAPDSDAEASPISMILLNAGDSEVGKLVTVGQLDCWQSALEKIIGSKSRAALFFAALMGFSLAQKTLHMDGIAKAGSDAHQAQLRHILNAALTSPDF